MRSHQEEFQRIVEFTDRINVTDPNYYFSCFHKNHYTCMFEDNTGEKMICIRERIPLQNEIYLFESGDFEIDLDGNTICRDDYSVTLLTPINQHNFLSWNVWKRIYDACNV